jgi:DNA-binding response OmpR family regulator
MKQENTPHSPPPDRSANSAGITAAEHYHLLVVDDEEATRRSLADILRLEGYQVRTAPDGDSAIALLKKADTALDLILLDLKCETDGLDVLRFITERRLGSAPDSVEAIRPVVILLTAHGSLESAIEALRHGAADYLLKPSSPAQILGSVRRGLERLEQASQKRQLIEELEASVRKLKESDTLLERDAGQAASGEAGDRDQEAAARLAGQERESLFGISEERLQGGQHWQSATAERTATASQPGDCPYIGQGCSGRQRSKSGHGRSKDDHSHD